MNHAQSLIYLLSTIARIQVESDVAETENDWQMLVFHREDRQFCGTIPDLVWQEWISGKIPDNIGFHSLALEVPDDWIQIVDGKGIRLTGIEVEVQITGHIITIPGSVSHYALINASSQEVERRQVKTEFEMSPGTYPMTTFLTEDELQRFIYRSKGLSPVTLKEAGDSTEAQAHLYKVAQPRVKPRHPASSVRRIDSAYVGPRARQPLTQRLHDPTATG